MPTSILRSPRFVLALAASIGILAVGLIAGHGQAKAAWSVYCNPKPLGPWGYCVGAARTLYQVYGWGDHRSVCVYPHTGWGSWGACSAGAGAGVYSVPLPEPTLLAPHISNHSAANNTVHGIAYQP